MKKRSSEILWDNSLFFNNNDELGFKSPLLHQTRNRCNYLKIRQIPLLQQTYFNPFWFGNAQLGEISLKTNILNETNKMKTPGQLYGDPNPLKMCRGRTGHPVSQWEAAVTALIVTWCTGTFFAPTSQNHCPGFSAKWNRNIKHFTAALLYTKHFLELEI